MCCNFNISIQICSEIIFKSFRDLRKSVKKWKLRSPILLFFTPLALFSHKYFLLHISLLYICLDQALSLKRSKDNKEFRNG